MREKDLNIYGTKEDCDKDYDSSYEKSRRRTNWDEPTAELPMKRLFLNQFGCYLPDGIESQLKGALEEATPLFKGLREIELQDLGEKRDAHDAIKKVFDKVNRKAPNFAEVATSKFLHMTLPHLMVMVDNAISDHLIRNGKIGRFCYGEDYFKVMIYYSNELNDLISDVEQNYGITRLEAIAKIRSKDIHALSSMPRIIDKHFFWIVHNLGERKREKEQKLHTKFDNFLKNIEDHQE